MPERAYDSRPDGGCMPNCRRGAHDPRCGKLPGVELQPLIRPLPPFDEAGFVAVCCEECGSTNLELDGWDIDKCRDCGHWRYR